MRTAQSWCMTTGNRWVIYYTHIKAILIAHCFVYFTDAACVNRDTHWHMFIQHRHSNAHAAPDGRMPRSQVRLNGDGALADVRSISSRLYINAALGIIWAKTSAPEQFEQKPRQELFIVCSTAPPLPLPLPRKGTVFCVLFSLNWLHLHYMESQEPLLRYYLGGIRNGSDSHSENISDSFDQCHAKRLLAENISNGPHFKLNKIEIWISNVRYRTVQNSTALWFKHSTWWILMYFIRTGWDKNDTRSGRCLTAQGSKKAVCVCSCVHVWPLK